MINEQIAKSMLEEFDGCDCDNPGSQDLPFVWLFGIEFGINEQIEDDSYSIETQLRFPFNIKAFKLLAVMNGFDVIQYREFANAHRPFVRGSNGYFKGNLYPYACKKVSDWPDDTRKAIGLSKVDYFEWCRIHRLPVIKQWVDKYQPKIFIGVGISCRSDFSFAVFGKDVNFKVKIVEVNSHVKHIYYFIEGSKKLVVVPHFSGPYGLNSNKSLQEVGLFIAQLLRD
jgi:hypothetical protein